MKQRLFWKILFSFWLTFMLIVEGVWVMFALHDASRKPFAAQHTERIAYTQIASAATVLRLGGMSATEALLASWPEAERRRLTVAPVNSEQAATPEEEAVRPSSPNAGDDRSMVTEMVQGRDQAAYRLTYDMRDMFPRPPRPGPLNIPLEMLGLGVIGGLMFSATLAWYLTRPVRRIRSGFEQLAQGQLGVRLKPHMGRRRDEIADLARDFDLMAERLQQLVASREQLLHDVSHELRSPLARLHMAIGLARQNPQRLQASLDRIELESCRLDELVGELLTLSRVEAGAPQLDDYFDLDSLVRAVVSDASFEANASGVLVETNIDAREPSGANPTVRGNAELIRRAVENVVRNAIHHSTSGQKVDVNVSADWDARSFVIHVADEGPGVRQDALQSMFKPFVRLPDAAMGLGFGLGLAIAKRAIAAHGGSIEAQNREERGLLMIIRLPFGPLSSA
ncbi:HAMP domain-containing sensor histidine kinase [Desulfocurvibacter africanus]|uniref:histidine kinase n=1 Tax=Desulfocurvibacter africanus subsp. africanus str. Walvis Bay TaxID=690850 RepID=F3Z392_DESAF|nr:ATP-binding protein [Desulfocurvibacter africanus]EGJ50336.1 integral membrane sensor signal transduction histidine kinase [Desulfocurvibacter africanus subsp. africanus str. Walvis Bay]